MTDPSSLPTIDPIQPQASLPALPETLESDIAKLPGYLQPRARHVAEAQVNRRERRAKISVKITDDGMLGTFSELGAGALNKFAMLEATGTSAAPWLNHVLKQLGPSAPLGDLQAAADEVAAGLAFIQGAEPKSEIEAALAAQMFAIHTLTLDTARRARGSETGDGRERWLNQTSKLARTFAAQAEALAKIKSGGQQTMTVQHIDARNSQNVIADTVVGRG